MARPRDRHPLGKCDEVRLELSLPAKLKKRLNAIATLHGKPPTTWARDALEKAIEGEWVFMVRRVGTSVGQQQPEQSPEEYPDA